MSIAFYACLLKILSEARNRYSMIRVGDVCWADVCDLKAPNWMLSSQVSPQFSRSSLGSSRFGVGANTVVFDSFGERTLVGTPAKNVQPHAKK